MNHLAQTLQGNCFPVNPAIDLLGSTRWLSGCLVRNRLYHLRQEHICRPPANPKNKAGQWGDMATLFSTISITILPFRDISRPYG